MKRSIWFGSGLVLAVCALPAMFRSGEGSMEMSPDGQSVKLQFDPDEGMPFTDFLQLAQRVFDQPVHYMTTDVKDLRLVGLGSQTVKRPDFRKFFEATLYPFDLIVIEDGGALWIAKAGGGRGAKPGYIKTQAPFVPNERLAEYADRYCVITSTIPLKRVNAQEAMNMLQSYFADPLIESVRAVTNANTLVVTGYGRTLNNLAVLTKTLDEIVIGGDATGSVPTYNLEKRVQALEESVQELRGKK